MVMGELPHHESDADHSRIATAFGGGIIRFEKRCDGGCRHWGVRRSQVLTLGMTGPLLSSPPRWLVLLLVLGLLVLVLLLQDW